MIMRVGSIVSVSKQEQHSFTIKNTIETLTEEHIGSSRSLDLYRHNLLVISVYPPTFLRFLAAFLEANVSIRSDINLLTT